MPLAAFPKCYLNDLVVTHALSVETWIQRAAQLDIDGLEFYWGFTPQDFAACDRLVELMNCHDLTMAMMCYSPDFVHPDPQQRKAEIAAQKLAVEYTARLGGKFCRVLSGQKHPEVGRADGIAMAAECISACLPTAQQHGVTLTLENHYKDGYWDYPEFAQKMDVFLELLAAIPRSANFGVNYDPSNALIAGDDPLALLQAVKERVVSMHASDRTFEGGTAADLRRLEAHPQQGYAPILRHGVIGTGLNDYDAIFSALKSVGFTGWISIEDGEDPKVGMENLDESAQFLRGKMALHGLT